jgi:2-polyprenyl-3-methyl-5-hydroxy-6-metoxy-1,4-benzoquinol methylase
MNQDRFYRITEANSFYNRWKNQKKEFNNSKKIIRPYKKKILKILERNIDIRKKKILEIGCFISDLLNVLKKEYGCKVYGIEPSSLACSFARKYYKLNIENSTLLTSKLFNLNIQNKGKFDVIICDDILSWVDRSYILPCLGTIDWMLKVGGCIFIRDFSPPVNFAFPNHHWKNKKIFNFKQKNGHVEFFLHSGKYSKVFYKKYISTNNQKILIKNKLGNTWSDAVIKKVKDFTHPIKKF